MNNFAKIIRPCTVPYTETRRMNVFCKIEIKDGKLSITGVEGPKSNGDALGSCGQIDMSLREVPPSDLVFAEGWTAAMFARFLEIWDQWHLNDMRPYDADMEAAGWPDLALTLMLGYSYTLTPDARQEKKDAEAAALTALRQGVAFTPTADQHTAANRPLSHTIWVREGDPVPNGGDGYRREIHTYGPRKGDIKAPERKTLGWLRPTDHPEGLLGRALVEGGNTYGGKWYRQELPSEVIDFLKSLPNADIKPAWV